LKFLGELLRQCPGYEAAKNVAHHQRPDSPCRLGQRNHPPNAQPTHYGLRHGGAG
jgi:hypothetical protein